MPDSSSSSSSPSSSISATALAIASASLARVARILLAIPLTRIIATLARALLFPLRIAALPIPRLLRILAIPFAPALYLLSFIDAATRRTLSFLASLEPIYTFLGTAAAVGFFAGIALAASSSLIVSLLSIHDDPSPHSHNHHSHPHSHSHNNPYNDAQRRRALKQPRHGSDLDEDLPRHFDALAGPDDFRQPRRKVMSYRTPPAQGRRRFAAGLLSQTIMEEEDDSDF